MKLITLQAKQVKEITGYCKGYNRTELYLNGELVSTYPAERKQPHRNLKTITHNCFMYKLEWI